LNVVRNFSVPLVAQPFISGREDSDRVWIDVILG
jgi:hypothetical protein